MILRIEIIKLIMTTIAKKSSNASITTGNKSHSRWINFCGFTHKLEKQLGGKYMSKNAVQQFDSFLKVLSQTISKLTTSLLYNSDRVTLNHKDIEVAVNLLFPINLAILATTAGNKAVQQFIENGSVSGTGVTKKDANKALRSGLIIPPYIAEKYLRMTSTEKTLLNISITEHAPIYMAGVLESIAKDILSVAIQCTKENNIQTLSVKHLQKAVLSDPEHSTLFKRLEFRWIMGGCLSEIHPSLLPNKEKMQKLARLRRKLHKDKNTVEKGTTIKKLLPGTKALREIKKYQKTVGLLQRKEHFKRFVKEQVNSLTTDKINFSHGTIEYIQAYIEDCLCDTLRTCVQLMVHCGRETVEAKDIILYMSLFQNTTDYKIVGSDNLAIPGLRRISFKAGVKRISADAFTPLREVASIYLYRLLSACVIIMQRESYKTVTLDFLKRAGSCIGVNLPFDVPPRRKSKRVDKKLKKNTDENENETETENEISIPDEEDNLSDIESVDVTLEDDNETLDVTLEDDQ